MRYQIIIPKKVQKDIAKIDGRYKQRILSALAVLSDSPHIGKKLVGEYASLRSYEVWPYRIIYEIYERNLLINIIRVGHRQGVY
ncbi:MAG: type II toxin-antitoxin system RelE/ParE family toxin [Candidatus Magasanikbacteria bacterium]|nr:type II toxin-antitoxin system RelE/ParE family toxin [Candidatus Magasanikbacteria bacterium]